MCCGTKICCFCLCLVLLAVAIGMLFGFGVFKDGFNKVKNTVHLNDYATVNGGAATFSTGRPFLGIPAPPPY